MSDPPESARPEHRPPDAESDSDLPVLFNDRNGSFNETEQQIEIHLARIEAEFQKASHSSETWDVWTTSIIGLDVLGACFALGYFGRNWWSRAVATH